MTSFGLFIVFGFKFIKFGFFVCVKPLLFNLSNISSTSFVELE